MFPNQKVQVMLQHILKKAKTQHTATQATSPNKEKR